MTCAREKAEAVRANQEEEEEDAADRRRERKCLGGTGDAQNGIGEKDQADRDTEESLMERAQGRPDAGKNSKPQFRDSGVHLVPGGTWLAQVCTAHDIVTLMPPAWPQTAYVLIVADGQEPAQLQLKSLHVDLKPRTYLREEFMS
ncbi:hypothetical protein NDU88_002120 [Pleurodeles waltl]|uniref:Uncharacterized protein n=1 Tax=Pleurodeles waltl TaxID=8319 RepID=A0AAV7NEI8_PLEWA|nr:hypothetical protein NDU88_002120 [Pleurodeles waltl]